MSFEKPTSKKELRYVDHTYSALSPEDLQDFMNESTKYLGFREREGGEKTSVLITGSHSLGLIEDTNTQITQEEVDRMNQESGNEKKRYSRAESGNLLIGKQFDKAGQRPGGAGYKADTNVASACIELIQCLKKKEDLLKVPHEILYTMAQTHGEPNKTDANNPSMPAVDISVFQKSGAQKLVDYILASGVDEISSIDVANVHKGTYIPNENDTSEKAEALTECSAIRKGMQGNDHSSKKALSATLRILGIHRKFYEEQERLLYEKNNSLYPTNIDIHTCYDKRHTQQGVDMIIGSKYGGSVHSTEMEYLFAAILKKHDFNVVLSTLNTFPRTSREDLEALRKTIDKSIASTAILPANIKETLSAFEQYDRKELEDKALIIYEERLNHSIDHSDKGFGIHQALCSFYKIPGETLSLEDMNMKILLHQRKLLRKLSTEDLRLFAQQNVISITMSDLLHYDNPVPGLSGLTSLTSRYNARDKYTSEDRPEIRSSIFQLEVVKSIMEDSDKRKAMVEALRDFINVIQQDDFNPVNELEKFRIADNS